MTLLRYITYINTKLFEHNRIRGLLTRQSLASELIEAARHTLSEQSRTAAVSYEAENVAAAADAVHGSQLARPGKENTVRRIRISPCLAFIFTSNRRQPQVIQSKPSVVGIPLHHNGRG